MNNLRSALLTLLVVPLVALAGDPGKKKEASAEADCHHPPAPQAAASAPAQDNWKLTRGEPLKGATAVALTELLASPQAHEGKTVRLEGKVRKACERKGCWMELAADDKSPGVRVTFKDYAFFVPTDSAGSQARVEGVVQVKDLSEGTAKHYESEGAMVPRGKDGKPREVQLVATGVELRR